MIDDYLPTYLIKEVLGATARSSKLVSRMSLALVPGALPAMLRPGQDLVKPLPISVHHLPVSEFSVDRSALAMYWIYFWRMYNT